MRLCIMKYNNKIEYINILYENLQVNTKINGNNSYSRIY